MVDQSDIPPPDGVGALFSVDAADNAEVVTPDTTLGVDQMWSTGTEDRFVHDGELVGSDEIVDDPLDPWSRIDPTTHAAANWGGDPDGSDSDGVWASAPEPEKSDRQYPPSPPDYSNLPPPPLGANPGSAPSGAFGLGVTGGGGSAWTGAPTPPGAPGAGGVFSSRPVVRSDEYYDELDEPDEPELLDDMSTGPSEGSPFSPGGSPAAGAGSARRVDPDPANDPWDAWRDPIPSSGPRSERREERRDERRDDWRGADWRGSDPGEPVFPDPQDFGKAVDRLHPDDVERARVPLAVCGALLDRAERVRSVVTGQMLGRPAAVVLTDRRVLVVNERRWRPIIDSYDLGPDLRVRGRQDGRVAALSFADEDRLTMVDGIGEVEMAVALAKATRDPSAVDEGKWYHF